MRVTIHPQGVSFPAASNRYTREKIRLSLGLFRDKISRVDIFLSKENGHHAAGYIRCGIKVHADGYPPFMVEESAADVAASIDVCLLRTRRAVGRRLDSLQHSRHGPPLII